MNSVHDTKNGKTKENKRQIQSETEKVQKQKFIQ